MIAKEPASASDGLEFNSRAVDNFVDTTKETQLI
jgi:hypothetical protein